MNTPDTTTADRSLDRIDLEDQIGPARMKLTALGFLLSEIKCETVPSDEVFHGLALIVYEIRDTLKADREGGAR